MLNCFATFTPFRLVSRIRLAFFFSLKKTTTFLRLKTCRKSTSHRSSTSAPPSFDCHSDKLLPLAVLFPRTGSNLSVISCRCLWTPAPPSTLGSCWSAPPASPPAAPPCCRGSQSTSCPRTLAGSYSGTGPYRLGGGGGVTLLLIDHIHSVVQSDPLLNWIKLVHNGNHCLHCCCNTATK